MVIDYSEQRQVPRNRPKRQPVGRYVATFLFILGLAYGGGFLTAWYLYRPSALMAQSQARPAAQAAQGQPIAVQPQPANPPASTGHEVPLSFYETLQKGNKSIIGSGLNPQKGEGAPAAKAHPTPQPVLQPVKNQPEQPLPQAKATPAPSTGDGKFSVQVASTKERKEAEELVARLVGKGYAAMSAESKVEGKGTWFRVRVGRHLTRPEAEELAARLKSGAVVVQEKE